MQLPSWVIPVPAILAGRCFRSLAPVRRYITPDAVVDEDIALPGLDDPPGVTSPDLEPIAPVNERKWFFFCNFFNIHKMNMQ